MTNLLYPFYFSGVYIIAGIILAIPRTCCEWQVKRRKSFYFIADLLKTLPLSMKTGTHLIGRFGHETYYMNGDNMCVKNAQDEGIYYQVRAHFRVHKFK